MPALCTLWHIRDPIPNKSKNVFSLRNRLDIVSLSYWEADTGGSLKFKASLVYIGSSGITGAT